MFDHSKVEEAVIARLYHGFKWCTKPETSSSWIKNKFNLRLTFSEFLFCYLSNQLEQQEESQSPIYESIRDQSDANEMNNSEALPNNEASNDSQSLAVNLSYTFNSDLNDQENITEEEVTVIQVDSSNSNDNDRGPEVPVPKPRFSKIDVTDTPKIIRVVSVEERLERAEQIEDQEDFAEPVIQDKESPLGHDPPQSDPDTVLDIEEDIQSKEETLSPNAQSEEDVQTSSKSTSNDLPQQLPVQLDPQKATRGVNTDDLLFPKPAVKQEEASDFRLLRFNDSDIAKEASKKDQVVPQKMDFFLRLLKFRRRSILKSQSQDPRLEEGRSAREPPSWNSNHCRHFSL